MVFKINKIVKNFLSLGFSNVLSQLLIFLVSTYYAIVLGKSLFGSVSLVQSILNYLTVVVLFGLQTYGTREIAKDIKHAGSIVKNIVILRVLLSALCYILVLVISFLVNKGTMFRNILLVYGLTLFPNAFILDWLFSGVQEMQYNAVYNVIKNIIPCFFIILFLRYKSQVLIIPIAYFIGLTAASLYHILVYFLKFKKKYNIKQEDSGIKLLDYMKFSFPFLASQILLMINNYADRIVIGFTRSDAETGLYSSAYYIIFFIMNIVAIIFTSVFPLLISYFHENDFDRLKKLLSGISRFVIMAAFPIFFGGVLLSKEIILLLFKKEYIAAYVPFQTLLIFALLYFIREIYGYELNAWHMEKKYLKIVFCSSMFNLVFNILITPKYGMYAASWITVISELINFTFMKYYAGKVFKTPILKNILRIIPSIVLMCISIEIFKHFNINIILNILAAIAVYFLSVILTKYISKDELLMFLKKREN